MAHLLSSNVACAVRRHVPTESTLLAGKRPRTFQLERSPISRFSSTRSHSRASNRLYQSNTVLKRHYCTDEKKEEAQETPESEKKTETQETIIDHSKLTREDYVQNPALLEDVELLSDEDLKLVRHHVNKEGKLSLPPMRMVIKHLQRRKTVVIAGCYGFLGNALKASLLSRGHEVIGISRNHNAIWPYNSGDTRQWWEIMGREAVPDCDALVQLTGAPLLTLHQVPNEETHDSYFASRGGLTELMAYHIKRTRWKPTVFIQGSNAGIYPASQTAVYDESYSGPMADDLVGAVNEHYEQQASLMQEYGIRTVQMRFGHVLSDHGIVSNLYRVDRKGRAFWSRIGSGEQWMPWIHTIDAVNMMIHAIEQEEVSGPVNAVAPEAIRQQQFANEISKILPFPTLKIPMNETVANWLLPGRANIILEGRHVVPSVAEATGFDFKFRTIASAVESLRPVIKPIDWRNPASHYFDPTTRDTVPRP